jgi:hypothetical protein
VRIALLVLVAALAAGVSPSVRSSVTSVRFESPRLDYTLRVPAGWKASVRPEDGTAVVTSPSIPNRNGNPERIRLPRTGVYIWIGEYGRVRSSGVESRPARIRLGEKRSHACGFGEGYMLRFSDHGRLLQVFVKVGTAADLPSVLSLLNSLEVVGNRPAQREGPMRAVPS